MADTIQIVSWALQYECPLRRDVAVVEPRQAIARTSRARGYSEDLRTPHEGFGVFGDTCVTSYTHASEPNRKKGLGRKYPASGFSIAQEFGPFGGVEQLFAMCGRCPANTTSHDLAQCCGTFYQHPSAPETEEQCRRLATRLGIEDDLATTFTPTAPLWHGLWTRSPLSTEKGRLLARLLSAILAEDAEDKTVNRSWLSDHLSQLRAFIRATEVAEKNQLALHVRMSPPGHVDLGYYTIFPHCPLCKAGARTERWQRNYPTELHECHVCGTSYSPAETASRHQDDFDLKELRATLGQEKFERLAAKYLIAQGTTADEAAAIVTATEAAERARQAKIASDRQQRERENEWVRKVIYAGLQGTFVRSPEDAEGVGLLMFTESDFAEVIRRAKEKGLTITSAFHHSKTGDKDRYDTIHSAGLDATLTKWRAEGCSDFFSATFRVPAHLLDSTC